MPYSHITRTAFGADAIAYARGDGTGHNGAEVRNEYTAGVNMLPDEVIPFEQQMRPYWERAHFRHTTQIDRLIVSFHPSELDPDKPEDCVLGLAIGCEIAKRNAPDNQSAVFLQKDGKGGKIHLHILTNDVNMSDCKGIDPSAYAHFHFQQIVDKVCHRYFDFAKQEAQPEKINHAVRGARAANEKIRADNELERQRAAEEGREVDPDKIRAERYIWQDDLRQRVKDAAARATDEQSFAHQLRLSGVELVPVKDKDKEPVRDETGNLIYLHPATKKQPAYYTYELADTSGFPDKIPQNLKSKSHKLGTNYQPEAVAKLFGTASPSIQDSQEDYTPSVVFETRSKPDAEDQQETPTVFFETPRRRKPPQKGTEEPAQETTEKPPEDKAMDDARNTARFYVLSLMRQAYGWQQKPKKAGPDGRERADFDELDRQYRERDAAFEQFTEWRVARRKELAQAEEKLPGIYVKDKITGHVFVPRDEFEKQFAEFLDKRDHPEKYTAAKEQPGQQPAPVEQQRPEQQWAEPEKPPVRAELAEQARREIAKGRSILYDELQRIHAVNEQRQKEQQEYDRGEDTGLFQEL